MKLTEEKKQRMQSLTGVTPGQAEQALNTAQGDELEALLWLEHNGIIESAGVGYYSTVGAVTKGTNTTPAVQLAETQRQESSPATLMERLRWFWRLLVGNRLEAYRKYDPTRKIECPLGALIALVLIAWYVVVVVLMIGICLGWRYRFAEPQLGGQRINRVVNQIDDWAEKARDDVKNHIGK